MFFYFAAYLISMSAYYNQNIPNNVINGKIFTVVDLNMDILVNSQ